MPITKIVVTFASAEEMNAAELAVGLKEILESCPARVLARTIGTATVVSVRTEDQDSDPTVEVLKPSGDLELSDIVDGEYIKKRYNGYTEEEARADFASHVDEELAKRIKGS